MVDTKCALLSEEKNVEKERICGILSGQFEGQFGFKRPETTSRRRRPEDDLYSPKMQPLKSQCVGVFSRCSNRSKKEWT